MNCSPRRIFISLLWLLAAYALAGCSVVVPDVEKTAREAQGNGGAGPDEVSSQTLPGDESPATLSGDGRPPAPPGGTSDSGPTVQSGPLVWVEAATNGKSFVFHRAGSTSQELVVGYRGCYTGAILPSVCLYHRAVFSAGSSTGAAVGTAAPSTTGPNRQVVTDLKDPKSGSLPGIYEWPGWPLNGEYLMINSDLASARLLWPGDQKLARYQDIGAYRPDSARSEAKITKYPWMRFRQPFHRYAVPKSASGKPRITCIRDNVTIVPCNDASVGQPRRAEVQIGVEKFVTDPDGTQKADHSVTSYAYQWQWYRADPGTPADKDTLDKNKWSAIVGATGHTYSPTVADIGKILLVEVRFKDDTETPEKPWSAPTSAVTNPTRGQLVLGRTGEYAVSVSWWLSGPACTAATIEGEPSTTTSASVSKNLSGTNGTVYFESDAFRIESATIRLKCGSTLLTTESIAAPSLAGRIWLDRVEGNAIQAKWFRGGKCDGTLKLKASTTTDTETVTVTGTSGTVKFQFTDVGATVTLSCGATELAAETIAAPTL